MKNVYYIVITDYDCKCCADGAIICSVKNFKWFVLLTTILSTDKVIQHSSSLAQIRSPFLLKQLALEWKPVALKSIDKPYVLR